MPSKPSQDELRRRLRAGRVLADLTVAELAARIPEESAIGERTLRKLESGETQLRPPILKELAEALGLPYGWFTVESIAEQFTPSPSWQAELAELRRELRALGRELGEDGHNGPGESDRATSPQRRGPRGTRQQAAR